MPELWCEDEACGNYWQPSRMGSEFVEDMGGHCVPIDSFSKDGKLTCPDCGKRLLIDGEIECDLTDPKCRCEDCRHEKLTTWKMD